MNRFLFLLLFFSTFVFANVVIEKRYFIDEHNAITKENIKEYLPRFEPMKKNSFGLHDYSVWVYLKIKNTTNQSNDNIIRFSYPLLDYIYVYELKENKLTQKYLMGDLVDFDARPYKSNDFIIPYTIKSNETKEFLFKVQSSSALNLGMDFYPFEKYTYFEKNKTWILGIYYGATIIMLIYNLILYFFIKDKIYAKYVVFHFVFLLLQLGLNGLVYEYFWSNTPQINLYFVPLALIGAHYFSIHFTQAFLELDTYSQKITNYLRFLKNILVILVLIVFLTSYSFSIKLIAVISAISPASLFIIGIYILYKQKTVFSKFYVIAWSFTLLGTLLTVLQNIGILPSVFITQYGSQIGAFCELSLLSIALAYKYNMVFLKLQKNEKELITLNNHLEEKVNERTRELSSLNHQLEDKIANAVEEIKINENALKQRTKLAAMGELIGLIAHQWRQPLATSNMIVSTLKTKQELNRLEPNYLTNKLNEIEKNNLYMSNTIEDFLRFFTPKHQKEYFLPYLAINEGIGLIRNIINKHHIAINIEVENSSEIFGFKDEYMQVILILITNSIQAFKEQEEKNIFIKGYTKNNQFYLEVTDNAGGIEPQIIEKIFEPYFTTKHQDQGTGLGLYMAQMIIEKNMQGSIICTNTHNGTRFTLISQLKEI